MEQNLRRAFLSLTKELLPEHDDKVMANALKKVRLQHLDATMDDAKDYFIMMSLDKKISPVHGEGKLGASKKSKEK